MSARPLGYARVVDPERSHPLESDVVMCSHCDRLVHLHEPDGTRKQGVIVHCHGCDRAICVPCAEVAKCRPLERRLDAMEARGRLRAAVEAG